MCLIPRLNPSVMFIALLSISVSPEVLVPSSPAPAIPSIEREKIYVCCPAFMFLIYQGEWSGWEGTPWDLKHASVRTHTCMPFWLKWGPRDSFLSHPPTLDTLCGPYRVWLGFVVGYPISPFSRSAYLVCMGWMASSSKMTYQASLCV